MTSTKRIIRYLDDDGELHREDGPALIYYEGSKEWYIHGELHREGKPAIMRANGDRLWMINGEIHRLDGPAVIHGKTPAKQYWIRDKYYMELEYINYLLRNKCKTIYINQLLDIA